MKKRIISSLCALIMVLTTIQPASAATEDELYNLYKATDTNLADLGPLFENATNGISAFNLPGTTPTDKESYRSMIALEAWQKGFENPNGFNGVKENITAAANKLATTKAAMESSTNSLEGVSSASIPNASSIGLTDPKNIFKVDGKEFIILKSEGQGSDRMFYVMARQSYGMAYIDGANQGRWDDTLSAALPYNLTNRMAMGRIGTDMSDTLPEDILRHVDVMHVWNIEPNNGQITGAGNKVIAPLSLISVSEYVQYADIIGKTENAYSDWTRTPVKGNIQTHFSVREDTFAVTNVNKSWNRLRVRPVFYLKSSFFKEEQMDWCGENVTKYLDEFMTLDEVNALYTTNKDTVFEPLTITPTAVTGNPVVGETLSVDYTYTTAPQSVAIAWERSLDGTTWEDANGTNSKTYEIKPADAGYQIRAKFTPTFNSVILGNGAIAYSAATEPVYTDVAIRSAVEAVNSAATISDLRTALQTHQPLFKLDYTQGAFPDSAATIFIQDTVNSKEAVIKLYEQSIKLDQFAGATGDDVVTLANYFLEDIDAYSTITVAEQKTNIITNLFNLTTEKGKVSSFVQKAEEFIMLERFNEAERGNVVALITEYASALGVDISGLTAYQLQVAGTYVAGTNYGTDAGALQAALIAGVAAARSVTESSNPIEGSTGERPIGGFVPPTTEKPGPLGTLADGMFTDLETVPWAVTAINSLAQKGVLSGSGDGTFSPDRLLTRNEFVKMIVVAFNIERTGNELSYADIDNNSWSAEYIKAAVDAGIIFGVDDTHFGDGMNISRQDVAVIAERILKYKEIELKSSTLKFDDSYEIADYALSAVAKMNYNGIMSGMSDKLFAPLGNTTRAQAAVVIYNLLNYYESQTAEDDELQNIVGIRNQNDKYDLVYQLGILKEEFAKDAAITRGELAAAIAVFGNYSTGKYEGIFKDVAANHSYAKEIEAVYNNNIMAPMTEETFAPDEIATYKQAYDAIIAACGYLDAPDGAYKVDIALKKEPVFAREQDKLTADMLKKMLYAALEVPVFDFESPNTLAISEKTILNVNFNTYKEKGIVNAVAGMAIAGREEVPDERMIITVGTQDYIYNVGTGDYSDYLGYEVTYYYTEADGEYEIVTMMVSEFGKGQLALSFDQITNAERNLTSITYQTSTKTKTAQISRSADFIYNGRRCYSITRDDLVPNNGYITLIDTDDNNEYDVVKIENYEYIMVAQIDIAQKSVLDKFSWQTKVFEEGDGVEKVNITKNGRYIRMDLISKGDVLAIAKSRDGKLINVEVSDKKVSGRVVGKNSAENEIQIDNAKLKTVKNFDFAGATLGMNVTVGIDANGHAVGYYTESSGSDVLLGYMYLVVPSELDDTRTIHMMTEDNEFVRLKTSTTITENGTRQAPSSLDGKSPQLIGYRLDNDGNVKHIYTAVAPPDTNHLVLSASHVSDSTVVVYNTFGMIVEFEHNLPKGATVFDVAFNDSGAFDKDNSRVTTISSQPIPQNTQLSGARDKLLIYNADDSNVSALCVYEHAVAGGNDGALESFNTQAFLINEIFVKYDQKSGEAVTAYKGYHNGKEVEYTMSKKMLDQLGTDLSKIKKGDVLLIWLSGTEITRFRRLFTFDKTSIISAHSTDVMCNYGLPVNEYSSSSQALKSYEYHDYGNTSSSTAGSRMATVYGDLVKIYKSETYTYPVVSFKIAGSETISSFTLDASTKMYVYNKRANTIRAIDSDSMNYADHKAVLTVRYGNVRDVIIYED